MNTRFGNLSGGERRYLIIWASLQIKRDLYLLDEPFANLDPSVIEDIIKVIYQKLTDGCTLLLSTHQFEGIIEEKTFITFLEDQRVKYSGNRHEFNRLFPSVIQAFK